MPIVATKKYTRNTNLLESITKADLSEVSKRVYLERWRTIMDAFRTNVMAILKAPAKGIAWIRKEYDAPATQKSYLSAILAIFRHNKGLKEQLNKEYTEWYAAFKEIHEKIDERYRKNQPSDKQIAGYVPYDDIVAKRDTLKSGSDERLLLSLYTYIPPLRCDFNQVRVLERGEKVPDVGDDPNYIEYVAQDNRRLVLREFKTADRMEAYEKNLPKDLVKELDVSMAKHPRKYIFEDRNGKAYRPSSFRKWVNRKLFALFDRHLTVSLIRHSFINSLDFNKLTVEEKERIAKEMTHTVGTQDRYRLIFDQKKSGKRQSGGSESGSDTDAFSESSESHRH